MLEDIKVTVDLTRVPIFELGRLLIFNQEKVTMCSRYVRVIDTVEIEDLFQDMLSDMAANYSNALPKQFSAYDVTTAIRKEVGPTVDVPHREVRKVVHNVLDNDANYLKTTHPIFQALTYERVGVPVQVNTTPVSSVPLNPVVPPLGNVAPYVSTKGLRKPDKRGTLTIPKSVLDNLQSVNKFQVYSGTNRINLKPLTTNFPTCPVSGIYTKDCHGNVRVTRRHLPKSATGSYLVKWDSVGSQVVIEGV
jgi:hypothetical protein